MTSSLALGVTVVIAVGFGLNRIAAARRVDNGNGRALNTRVETIPSALVASLGGFTRAEYFLADEGELRTVPTVGQRAG